MRNPTRIPVVIKRLDAYWKKHPDLRLAQIIVSALKAAPSSWSQIDVFYAEDGRLLDGLKVLWDEDKKKDDGDG